MRDDLAVSFLRARESDRALAFFCENIEKGTQGAQPNTTGYDVDELIATIKRSAATGEAAVPDWHA